MTGATVEELRADVEALICAVHALRGAVDALFTLKAERDAEICQLRSELVRRKETEQRAVAVAYGGRIL